MKVSKNAMAMSLAMVFLAGCSGGGGGENRVVQFTAFSKVPKDGTTNFNGTSRSVSFTEDGSGTVTATTVASGPNKATATLITENDNAVAIRVNVPGANASFNRDNGDTIQNDGAIISAESANGQDLLFVANGKTTALEHQTFGVWVTGAGSGSGRVGTGSFGSRTASNNLPPAGSNASYDGATIGHVIYNDGERGFTVSGITVDTDFSHATITTYDTNVVDARTGASSLDSRLDFAGDGPVSGTRFAAPVSSSIVDGTANGQFYGPAAQEVGGTFVLTGGTTTYIGSFGATK